MQTEYLFDFGQHRFTLLLPGNIPVHLGPGKMWLPEEVANQPYFKMTSFKPLDKREVGGSEPVMLSSTEPLSTEEVSAPEVQVPPTPPSSPRRRTANPV